MSQSNGVCFPTCPTSINEKVEAKTGVKESVNKTALITAVETSGIQQLQRKMAGRGGRCSTDDMQMTAQLAVMDIVKFIPKALLNASSTCWLAAATAALRACNKQPG